MSSLILFEFNKMTDGTKGWKSPWKKNNLSPLKKYIERHEKFPNKFTSPWMFMLQNLDSKKTKQNRHIARIQTERQDMNLTRKKTKNSTDYTESKMQMLHGIVLVDVRGGKFDAGGLAATVCCVLGFLQAEAKRGDQLLPPESHTCYIIYCAHICSQSSYLLVFENSQRFENALSPLNTEIALYKTNVTTTAATTSPTGLITNNQSCSWRGAAVASENWNRRLGRAYVLGNALWQEKCLWLILDKRNKREIACFVNELTIT